ncbi:unnamed protein product [Brassicogethes aeneus]|uniref:Endonuclease-reverse transcriptase n=1 Tax=Brassicogethes aeneus TaxID=1431903 RepID=A0A9P0ARV2_BRAAE|nr:unnamed protein product [Brassicogethes aeneus]
MSVSNEDLYKLIIEGNNSLKQDFKDLKSGIHKEINNLKSKNEELENENRKLKNKLLEVERRQKKYNIIVYGLDGNEEETENKIIDLFNETLQTQCKTADFRDIFRIGKVNKDIPRSIVVETQNYKLKKEILKNVHLKSKLLKEKKIFITPEYATDDYLDRKLLGSFLRTAKTNKPDAKIRNNKLVIDEEEYTLEYLKRNPDFLKVDEACASSKNLQSVEKEIGQSPSKYEKEIPKRSTRFGKK